MKQTVQLLREGWHGNGQEEDVEYGEYFVDESMGNVRRRKLRGVDCSKLIATSLKFANEKFIPIAGGISGTIDNLVVDEDYVVDTVDMPIDMVINLRAEEDDDFQGEENTN